ncbi:MAG: hypothetical protein SGJ02_01700 [bacterium]|nr:hypothetical protein [bacterium]
MGVIYIGDRFSGKTHLAMELANPKCNHVKVVSPSYDQLKSMLYDEENSSTKATDAAKSVYQRFIQLQVTLPTGNKQISVDWLDTPGEIWRASWREDNPKEWEDFMQNIRSSEGVLLIMSPYRESLDSHPEKDLYITQQQWINRFNRWVDFFRHECPNLRHILICLNKADLFCEEFSREAGKLAYKPHGAGMNWQQRQSYVCNQYFRPVLPSIEEINRSIRGLSVRCFITSVHERSLLELPWIYLATFLAT